MSEAMNERTRQYWRLKAAFQELFGITDDEEMDYPEVSQLISLCANLALSFKEKGIRNVVPSGREEMLKEIGIAVLKRRSK